MTPVVLDTNILVSSFFSPRGNEARVVELFRQQKIAVFITGSVLAEYEIVLHRPKFAFASPNSFLLLDDIRAASVQVVPLRMLSVCPDESDNRFLECAEAASAAFLVTGNKRHFPASHGVTRIENAATFLAWFSLQ